MNKIQIQIRPVWILLLGIILGSGVLVAADYGEQKVWRLGEVFASKIDDDLVTGTINLAASSAQYTLPRAGDPYLICARGNRAYVECGANPTVTTSAGGYTFSIPDSMCLGPFRLSSAKCAHIASSASGQIEFIHFDPNL